MSIKTVLFSLGSVAAIGCFTAMAQAGDGLWSDHFDSYADGSDIVGQGDWEGWFNDPGASGAVVSSAQALSAPHSLDNSRGDDTVQQYDGFNLASGTWVYTANIYIPGGMAGTAYFIMLNAYDAGNVNLNWSTQVSMTPGGDTNSEFENGSVPTITDEWVEMRVLIDLDNDVQSITYGGQHLTQKSWREGVSGGGASFIDALDLWGNNAGTHYYDDISIMEAPTAGACCLPDGSCDGDAVGQGDCDDLGGTYQGDGSTCATAEATLACLAVGDCGTILNLPDANGSNFSLGGTTCGGVNGCDLVASNDFQAEVILPFDAEWTIDICGSDFDTQLKIGSECCTQDIASIDDTPGCGNGLQSSFTGDLTAGTYFVTIEGINQASCGNYVLAISTACVLEVPKGASDEDEPDCAENGDTNDGCNDPDGDGVFNFGSTFCGDVISGSLSYVPGVSADTDWYEIIVEENTTVNLTQQGDGSGINFGFIQYNKGFEGSGDCTQISGFVNPFSSAAGCQVGTVSADLTPGIWWIWTALPFGANDPAQDCPVNYILSVECGDGGSCDGDVNGDGAVNGTDLILLLGAWGTDDADADIDGSGNVDGTDLILLLGAWGDCP